MSICRSFTKSAAGVLHTGIIALLSTGAATAATGPDGHVWYAHDAGTRAYFNSVGVAGEEVVAAANGGQIRIYKGGQWQPMEGWEAFREGKPFGDAKDAGWVRAAATRDGAVWIGSFAQQGGDVRMVNGAFGIQPRGTSARVVSVASYDNTVLMGLNNGRVTVASELPSGKPFRVVHSLPDAKLTSVIAVGGTSSANVWAATGGKVYRATNAVSHSTNWTEQTLPEYVQGGIRSLSVSTHDGIWFGASEAGRSILFHWQNGAFDPSPLHAFTDDRFFNITGIYAQDVNNVWIVGDGGNLWYFNGTVATQIDLGTDAKLTAISGSDRGIWVVGSGVIFSTVAP